MALPTLHRRILDISYRHRLSHIGSCISCVDIIDAIYRSRQPDEPFCLGNGHAGLALYVVLERYLGLDGEKLLAKHGIHATRDLDSGIYVSGGSLGQVETVAMGMALARRDHKVWLLSSDGGAAEGSFWETLRYKAEAGVANLRWMVNVNGFGAYREVDRRLLREAIHAWCPDVGVPFTDFASIPFLQGVDAHYHVMTEADHTWVEEQG